MSEIVQRTESQVNQMKIENYQNAEQNKQLLQLVSNKEREIAQLRLKLVQLEEELAKYRKKALEYSSPMKNPTSSNQIPAYDSN